MATRKIVFAKAAPGGPLAQQASEYIWRHHVEQSSGAVHVEGVVYAWAFTMSPVVRERLDAALVPHWDVADAHADMALKTWVINADPDDVSDISDTIWATMKGTVTGAA